jgi:CxxC motif-containing protein (DUF1111 family)
MGRLHIFATGAALFVVAAGTGMAQVQLSIQPGVQLSWLENTNDTYQLQWSSNPATTWTDLIAAAVGNGITNTDFDPFPSGARSYQLLDIVPGVQGSSSSNLIVNGGFESGTGTGATDWTVDTAAGGPVYGVRTNDNPHSGLYNFEVYLASVGAGPVVQFHQVVPVVGGTTYPFTFYAATLPGSQGQVAQWRILWNAGGDTGYQTFTPVNSVIYGLISNSVTAPASATSGTLYFHFAGAAVTNWTATIDIDDVALGANVSSPGTPTVTNVLPVASLPTAQISWPSTPGVEYVPQSTTDLVLVPWTNNYPMVQGDGTTKSFLAPMTNSTGFFRLQIPPVVVLPPTNLSQVPSGTTNAIGLAWTASASFGVTDYRMSYTDTSTTTTNTTDLGNVTSTIISGLTSGDTYFVSIVAISPNGQSSPATVTGQPDTSIGVFPLYDETTLLEPDTVYYTPSNLVTRISDRPRGRHARECEFMIYDTYLIFYWEQRMTTIEIDDSVAMGGNSITWHMWSLNGLTGPPNIRFFFEGQTTVAQYLDNEYSTQADSSLTNWTWTETQNYQFNRPIEYGDRIEFEFSPFMLTVTNGQDNYYGGAILYIAGQGIVPWQEGATNDPGNINAAIDSVPMLTNGWLAGVGTMPYQYSCESNHMFNQLAPNASPLSGQPFVLGRRLHHTDMGTGAHSEPGNPIFTQMVGLLGPNFTGRSCDACHQNNGRALPPGIGALMTQSVVHVGIDASGTPDPVLGSVLQSQCTTGAPLDTVWISGYTTTSGTYGDGTPYTLQKPNYAFSGRVPSFYSVRIAPQLVGMGLLEAVPESTIEAMAGPSSNGVNGTVRLVTDPETGDLRLGRFTYKGAQCSVQDQIAAALDLDMSVTTTIFPVMNGNTNAGPIKLDASYLTNWVRYVDSLGVNARRSLTNALQLQGEQLFASANCTQCHTPTLQTSPYAPIAELRNQTIHPYTDLLLHDMGTGLADNMGEGNATGSQWRTSPLWSIGLTAGVSGGEAYLHDGRARSLEEAILWHGGEGFASEEAFRNMSASDRAALIAFLYSL